MAVTVLTFSKPPSTNALFLLSKTSNKRIKTPEYRRWLKQAMQEVMIQPRLQHPGKVRISYKIRRTNSLADIGNLEKASADMLVEMGVIRDDKFVESIFITWGDVDRVRCRITDCQ